MKLDAVAVARAFEVMLPATPLEALFIVRNPHRAGDYRPAGQYMNALPKKPELAGPLEQMRIEATNELWIMESRPGSNVYVAAATLPALAAWLEENGLAFGS